MMNKTDYNRFLHFVRASVFALAFVTSVETSAQAPDWTWAKSAGGSAGEYAYSVAADPSGNGYSYVAGYFESDSVTFGSTTLTNSGEINLYIVKYDAAGNVLWAKTAAGANVNTDKAVAVTGDPSGSGDIYVGGFFSSPSITFGSTTLYNAGNFDVFIVKYDADGNALWAKSAGGGYTEFPNSIACDASGNVYMTGVFGSPSITFGSTTLNNTFTSNYDMFIVKYDADGNALWAKSAGGTSHDEAQGVAVDPAGSGDSYVVGRFASSSMTFGLITLTNAGGNAYDAFIVKYDASGNALWAKSAGGTDNDYAFSVSVDESGNSYTTGFFSSPSITFGSSTLTHANGYDMYIVKYDADGNELWAKNPGGYGIAAQSIASDPAGSGDSYVTGYFADTTITFGSTTLTNSATDTSPDIFLVKYDGSGNVQWAKSAEGINPDEAFSVAADAFGNVYVAGNFYSPSFTFDSTTVTSVGVDDMFLAKIGDTTLSPPVSAFLSSDTALCEKFCISFSDESLNNPVSWNWIFEGATPSTSSDQNPTNICHNNPGNFDVTLITANANGISDTLTLSNYITIYPNPFAPTISQNGNTLTSSSATTYQWYLDSNIIPGATNQSYTFTQSGLYTVEIGDENGCKSQSSIQATVTGIVELSDNFLVNISGNPSNDQLMVEAAGNSDFECELVNMMGERLYQQTEKFTSSAKSFSIDLSDIPSGIYFLVVHSGTESKTFKVVKQ